MENVKIKEEVKAEAPKKVTVKKVKKDEKKVKFMEDRNAKRKAAGHKGLAYSEEQIKAYK